MRILIRYGLLLTTSVAGACWLDRGVAPRRPPPSVGDVAALPNTFNALAATVTCRVTDADSARLIIRRDGEAETATPFSSTPDGTARLAALGLRAAARYSVVVQAIGEGGTTESEPVQLETGSPPAAIRSLHLAVTGAPTAGYTLVVPLFGEPDGQAFIVAFDGAGELRWYRAFAGEGWAVEAKQQANGDFTTYLGRSYGWQPSAGRFVEVAPSGEEVRSFQLPAPAYTDPHELLLTFRGGEPGGGQELTGVHMIGYEIRLVDLRPAGGAADAPLAIHTIVRQGATGTGEFLWNAADHFTIADWPSTVRVPPPDLVHPSSLALDRDGNYVVSLQGMDEITKIDAVTGATIWRLGGRHNEFTILDDPLGGWSGQHSVRVLDDGHLLFLDDRARLAGEPARAVEYALDVPARTARLVWEYRPDPPQVNPMLGSVQRLRDGATLVGFGVTGRVVEVDAVGQVRWNGLLVQDAPPGGGGGRAATAVQFYRAIRVPSLYRYRAP